jgi:hypothetical protein
MAPGQQIIVCQDTSQFFRQGCVVVEPVSWETLSRDDTVVLRSGLGVLLDHVSYVSSWGVETGRTLERVRPDLPSTRENWGTCQDESGGTPCQENSIHLDSAPLSGQVSASPNPLEVDGTTRMVITYSFPFLKAYSRVRIFDRTGIVVREVCNGKSFHGQSSELWDGTDDAGESLPTGIYVVLVEATSQSGHSVAEKLAVALVRRD